MDYQKTINEEVSYSGVGLHTGQEITMRLRPAPENTGLVFIRKHNGNNYRIKADVSSVIDAPRRTTLGVDGARVHTVEHLLAALTGMGVDNLEIEIDGEEVPEIDGSALPYARLIEDAGLREQNAPRVYLKPRCPVAITKGDAYICAVPSDELKISFTVDYGRAELKSQYAKVSCGSGEFIKEIAPARTFCFEDEAKALQGQGMGKGANMGNTLVIGSEGILNGELRFENEFVRHKILDLLGDLTLVGGPVHAEIVAVKSGHVANLEFAKALKKAVKTGPVTGKSPQEGEEVLGIEEIKKILPHKYPFLLVDRIIEIEDDKRIVGIKNVSVNENFFVGHFPQRYIMPGVLLIEAMAQTAGVLMLRKEENFGKLAYVVSIDKVKLRRPVVPGDQLRMEAHIYKMKARTGKVRSKTFVDGQLVAEAEFVFSLVEA